MTKDEITQKLSGMFEEVDVEWDPHTNILTLTNMYAQPDLIIPKGDFSIGGLLRQALGVTRVEELEEIARSGCDSCDYGSEYGWEFKVTL